MCSNNDITPSALHSTREFLFTFLCLMILGMTTNAFAIMPLSTSPPLKPESAHLVSGYGKIPLSFEANHGQTDSHVKYISRGPGYGLFLTPTEAVMTLHKPNTKDLVKRQGQKQQALNGKSLNKSAPETATTLRMSLVGAKSDPVVEGLDELPGKVNYLKGSDPTKWHKEVPTYAKVKYEKVYPGIDLIYYGNQRLLEHDFVVSPGANPGKIQLAFAGAERLAIEKQGDLVLKTASGDVRLRKPRIYQDIDGQQREIAGGYILHSAKKHGKAQVGFQVAVYDQTKPLIIDPVLVYSTYLGGSGSDAGQAIAVDSNGNAYVTVNTQSSDFPTVNAKYPTLSGKDDAFVFKLSSDGQTVLYSTYLGGSDSDYGQSIAVDSNGNAYVSGYTYSSNFPTVNAKYPTLLGGQDAFVFKLSSDGQTVSYSTYLGGSGADWGQDIAVDGSGNAYVTGSTQSSDFPTVNAKYPTLLGGDDGFVFKLSGDGQTVLYSTYLWSGGSGGKGIAVDGSGNAYVTGSTQSTNFPTVNAKYPTLSGGMDAFVFKLSSDGQTMPYSTYLGGSGTDYGWGIAVDNSGNAYVTGATNSANFPTVNAKYSTLSGAIDAFVFKLSSDGQTVSYSTYLGGGGSNDAGYGIAVDGSGNAYVTGSTDSVNFPTVNAKYPTLLGVLDAFVFKLSSDGQTVRYSTYLGGNDNDSGSGITVDSSGNTYVTGITRSSNFPTVNPVQGAFRGVFDGFITKISNTFSVAPNIMTFASQPIASNSASQTVTVSNNENQPILLSTLSISGTNSSDFAFSSDTCSNVTIAPATSCTFAVTFNPTATGSKSATLQITNLTSADIVSMSLSGVGAAAPVSNPILSVTPPPSLDFGPVTINTSQDVTFTVTNTGTGTLTGSVSTSAPFSIASGASFSLAAGDPPQSVVVRFIPTTTGTFAGNVGFTSNGGNNSKAVTGIGIAVLPPPPTPKISISPTTTLDFGTVNIGQSADRTFTISNTGNATLTGTCTSDTNPPFSLPNGCNYTVDGGKSTTVSVRFSPTVTQTSPFTGNVIFSSNGGTAFGSVVGIAQLVPVGRNCDNIRFRLYDLVNGHVCPLLNSLRDPKYLNIPRSLVSDEQLRPYVLLHKNALQALIYKINYGQTIDDFLKIKTPTLKNKSEIDFINLIDNVETAKSLADILLLSAQILTLPDQFSALDWLNQYSSVLDATINGIKVYGRLRRAITAFNTRNLLFDYIQGRCGITGGGTCSKSYVSNSETVWADFLNTYGLDQIQFIINDPNATLSDGKLWFENALSAYLLVGFADSMKIRTDEGLALTTIALSVH